MTKMSWRRALAAALCVWAAAPQAFAQKADAAECGPQASFDCAKANGPVEKAICASEEAKFADCFLGYAYRDARRSLKTEAQKQALLEDQRAWLRRRDATCGAKAACLTQTTRERFVDLVRRYDLSGPLYVGD